MIRRRLIITDLEEYAARAAARRKAKEDKIQSRRKQSKKLPLVDSHTELVELLVNKFKYTESDAQLQLLFGLEQEISCCVCTRYHCYCPPWCRCRIRGTCIDKATYTWNRTPKIRIHEQKQPSKLWNVYHHFNCQPSVEFDVPAMTIVDAKAVISHSAYANWLQIRFNVCTVGIAFLTPGEK